jgi:hypothetical protein
MCEIQNLIFRSEAPLVNCADVLSFVITCILLYHLFSIRRGLVVFVLKAAISIHPPSLRRDLKWNIEDMYEEHNETDREVSMHIYSRKNGGFH